MIDVLNREQLKVLSGISANLGHICIASIVVPLAIPTIQNNAAATVVFGSLSALIFWASSILIVRHI